MPLCLVAGCRHSGTHLTGAHRCGRCGQMGHGRLECGNPDALFALRVRRTEASVVPRGWLPPPVWCTVPGCTMPQSHAAEAHHCDGCGGRGAEGCTCQPVGHETTSFVATCPSCKLAGQVVDVRSVVYTGADCVVCMESGPSVVFETCRHANVCATCVRRLAEVGP